jgi:hypothetical protein
VDVERPESPAFETTVAKASARRERTVPSRVPPAPRRAGDGFDLRTWLRTPRYSEAPGVYGFGRDERQLKQARIEREARTRPDATLIRRAVLWLVVALFTFTGALYVYVWLVMKTMPEFLWSVLLYVVPYVVLIPLYAYLGRWHELVWPYLRPYWQRMDRRAEANGRPRPEQVRRAALFLAVGFVLWMALMTPFVELLLLIFPRAALHDGQWLVRLVYNGAFLAGAAWLGRWDVVLKPYAVPPRERAAGPEGEEDGAPDADLWPELRAAGQDDAADLLDEEADTGRLRDIDYLRLRRVIEAGDADRAYLADVAEEIADNGAAACRHGSGQRDVRPRRADHDLLTGQVRIGTGTTDPKNDAVYRGTGFALEPDTLGTSMLVVGAANDGEPARLLDPVIETMSLRALAGTASLVVIDAKGDEFERPGGYDREVVVGDPDSPSGLDLYGGAASPEDAADRLAAAALPAGAPGLDDGASNALRQVLSAYVAAHGRYPEVGTLLDLLDGTEASLAALEHDLAAAGRLATHERALRSLARGDDAARLLVQRLAVLERPGVGVLFAPGRERFAAADIARPLRVRIALNEAAHPEAARLIGRLVLAQFVQAMATHGRARGPRRVFACLVAADAGRLVDEYTAKGLHWARNRRAGLVLSVRSLDDLAPALRTTVFDAAGCKAVVPGASRHDAELFAEHWGKTERQEELSVTTGTPDGGLFKRMRLSVLGALFGEKAGGRSKRVTMHTVERYRWSPAEITGDLATRHAIISLTTRKGGRTPPVLIDLGR